MDAFVHPSELEILGKKSHDRMSPNVLLRTGLKNKYQWLQLIR